MLCAAGVILMGVGAYVQVGARNYLNFLSETYLNTPIFIIIALFFRIIFTARYRMTIIFVWRLMRAEHFNLLELLLHTRDLKPHPSDLRLEVLGRRDASSVFRMIAPPPTIVLAVPLF